MAKQNNSASISLKAIDEQLLRFLVKSECKMTGWSNYGEYENDVLVGEVH